MPCSKESPKEIYKKEKIKTDKRRKHFFHTFLYLLGEWTNQRYVPRHSVVPKTPDSKIGVVGSTSLPEKEVGSQKTWVFITFPPAPNSPLQNTPPKDSNLRNIHLCGGLRDYWNLISAHEGSIGLVLTTYHYLLT